MQSEDDLSKKNLINWILKLVALIPAKYSTSSFQSNALMENIKIWTNCNVIRSLLDLIKKFIISDDRDNIDYILIKLIEHSPNSDWVTAYLITFLPNEETKISHCIQFLLSSNAMRLSITSILAYLSEHNPQAIVDSSKSDIAFLINLSTTSKPLLDLLALEAVKEVDVKMLNNLKLNQDLKKEILYCIFNAPNSFELLKLLFDFSVHPDANDNVKFQSLAILELITHKLHQTIYSNISNKTQFKMPIIKELQNNSKELVCNILVNSNESILQKIQIRIVHILCVNYGVEFTTDIIFNFLNTLNSHFDHDFNLDSDQSNDQLLMDLLKSLRLPFGSLLQNCFDNFIECSSEKRPRFWANLFKILETDSNIKIELDTITDKFAEQLQKEQTNLNSLYFILLIMQSCLEKQPIEASKSNHYLCLSLSACLMKIINSLTSECKNFKSKIIIINIIQKCMSILSKSQNSNRHIICRALIESEIKADNKPDVDCKEQTYVNLLKENSGFNSAFKFRKIPLVTNRESLVKIVTFNDSFLRKQIILDTIRSCCSNSSALLAELLVETLTPDVMFNDKSFPDEDFLKVTIERDLYITRQFELHPILWNLVDLIAKEKSLKNCSLLISALLAVQLTQWSSPTANKDKVKFTEKLLKLISNSEMVPAVPFKYLPLVLDHLDTWEIYCMLNDVWRFLKDNYHSNLLNVNNNSTEQKFQVVKHYFERLRIVGSGKIPGKLYVKIFKSLNKELVKC